MTHVVLPAVTGALGIAGGLLLGRNKTQRNVKVHSKRKVLGIPVPGLDVDMAGVGQQIGEAGRQFAALAREVQAARQKAEKIGRALQ